MFDELVTTAARSALGAAAAGWARVESAACARRLAAMVAVLDALYAADGSADREQWYLDNWGAACAQIGAAQQITTATASNQLLVATALRDRLPKVGAVFTAGGLTYRLASTIVWRTAAIKDPAALAAVDAELAEALSEWPAQSEKKTIDAIDAFVIRHDPHAIRRSQNAARGRSVDINIDDTDGTATLWAILFAADAKALDNRLNLLCKGVCDADPRTLDQRRSDALGALGHGADRLACLCGQPDCTGAATAPTPGSAVVYVITHEDTLTDDSDAAVAQDAALDGEQPRLFDKPQRELTLTEALTDTDPGEPVATAPGAMLGGPVLSGPIIRRLALTAKVRRIFHPGDAPPEPRYTPSSKLADFVRCRDLTCRFPGCDVPATGCDIDHTIPHPFGPTCASNLKCVCRFHHLLKTFWHGVKGWRDRQLPDGTVIWTAPDGLTHTTRPGSHLLFPTLCTPTAPVTVATSAEWSTPNTGLTMPRRAITRTEARRRRINDERRLNEEAALLAEAESVPPF